MVRIFFIMERGNRCLWTPAKLEASEVRCRLLGDEKGEMSGERFGVWISDILIHCYFCEAVVSRIGNARHLDVS